MSQSIYSILLSSYVGHYQSTLFHRYLIYLDRALGVQKVSPFKRCIQTGFILLHTNLWLISGDKSLLKLVDMHWLKWDYKKLTSACKVFISFYSSEPTRATWRR